MKLFTGKRYSRLSPRSLLLYELAKRRAERMTGASDGKHGVRPALDRPLGGNPLDRKTAE